MFLEVLAAISTKCGHASYEGWLAASNRLLAAVLDHLKESLTSSSWKSHPVHKQALVWVMKSLKVIGWGMWARARVAQ